MPRDIWERRQEIVTRRYQAVCEEYAAWEDAGARMRALLPKALEVLAESLDDPKQGPRVALALLKLAGLDAQRPTPPSLPLIEFEADRYLVLDAGDDDTARPSGKTSR